MPAVCQLSVIFALVCFELVIISLIALKFILASIGLFCVFSLSGQQNLDKQTLMLMSPAERCRLTLLDTLQYIDSADFVACYDQMMQYAREENDLKWQWLLEYHRFRNRGGLKLDQTQIFQLLDDLEQKAKKKQWPVEVMVIQHYRKFEQYNRKIIGYEQMYAYLLDEHEHMTGLGMDRFRDYEIPDLMYHSGKFMFDLEDDGNALIYFQIGEQYAEFMRTRHHILILTLNHLQTIYQRNEDNTSAIRYAQKINESIHHIRKYDSSMADFCHFWEGMSSIDLASMLIQEHKFAEGEQAADHGYLLAQKVATVHSIYQLGEFEALLPLISIKLELNKIGEAESLLKRAEQIWAGIEKTDENYFKPIRLWQNKAKLAEIKGNFGLSLQFRKTADALKDSLQRRTNIRKLEKIQQKIQAQSYSAKIQQLEADKKMQVGVSFLMVLIISLVAGMVTISLRKKRRLTQLELEAARQELEAYIQHFREKSELAESLRQEINQLSANSERSEQLQNLLQSTILTEQDWIQFRLQFEKIYPNFMDTQKRNYPEITQAELRYLVLEQLQLSTTEMARMLGVSDGSIRQTRSRLRKKMASSLS
jgi:predicted DNA-binding protein (UPF0251 family)